MPETAQDTRHIWRAYVSRWAHDPLSGEGAARFGGRWNPIGTSCLYAGCELSTAWAEYNQGFVQHPATIVHLLLTGSRLADLRTTEGCKDASTTLTIHQTQWRDECDHGRKSATHILAARLARVGFDGLIYPSFMSTGGSCVALWRWNEPAGARLDVVDPEQRLPRNQASWR